MFNEILIVIITTMLPIAELRGGIPLGLALGLPATIVIPLAFAVNCLVFFPIYFGMTLFYERFFERFGWARIASPPAECILRMLSSGVALRRSK